MGNIIDHLPLELPLISDTIIIKVIGVGGGGGNAVNHMYRQGITDVSFVVCNTDNQALIKSPVPIKIQLGSNTTEGLGAGGNPEVAKKAAEESLSKIQAMFQDSTKMVFITAGMGGGTGTGASPVVAKVAHDMGILTVGIVTIPFAFEGNLKIRQALEGVAALSEHVDAILVINNEKLKDIYPDLELSNAFAKADDVLTNAAKAIAEIITIPGYINTDFADVYSIMKDGNVAIMNTGCASGEHRISKAIENALNSPLLNTNDVSGASKILLSLYCSTSNQIRMDEVEEIHHFMGKVGTDVQVIWGATFDDELGDDVKITLIATGFEVGDIPGMPSKIAKQHKDRQNERKNAEEAENIPPSRPTKVETRGETTGRPNKEEEIKKAIGSFYGEKIKRTTTIGKEIEENVFTEENNEMAERDLPTITLSDLDNDDKLDDLEKTPAWKRKLHRK
ncbi:MAG: cell division protein FtsZ [Prevotellaceae bacterium]|jgi:cell division protein FtsZ|nr:cell division protein FtsZ [Prevotellaceae bacterium]